MAGGPKPMEALEQSEPMLKQPEDNAIEPALKPLLGPEASLKLFGGLVGSLALAAAVGAACMAHNLLQGLLYVMGSQVAVVLLLICGLCPMQVILLQRPHWLLSRAVLPAIELIECGLTCSNSYLELMKRVYGSNYCSAGQVLMGDFAACERLLTSPQARGCSLGAQPFMRSNLPGADIGGRMVMLLALSDEGAGGNGDHTAFKSCVLDHVLGTAWELRWGDAVCQRLLQQLAEDYKELVIGKPAMGNVFFSGAEKGIIPYLVKQYHYVMFGLDPEDKETQGTIMQFFSGFGQIAHYLEWIGASMGQHALIDKIAAIYESSPALASFKEGCPAYRHMTRKEAGRLLVALVRIAAVTGSQHLATTAMGGQGLPFCANHVDVTRTWDTLDLDDRESIQNYLMECTRLFPPVSTISILATEPLHVRMLGLQRTFPVGTKVLIPLTLGNLDAKVWGSTATAFDPKRSGLRTNLLSFASVGDRHNGRICPGRKLALETLTDVLQLLGRMRRAR